MGRVLRSFVWLRAAGIAALLVADGRGVLVAQAQSQPQTVVDVLHQISDSADVIFAGQVLAIRQPNTGVVEVEFRVDEAVRGCSAGTPYVLREWAGLWGAGGQRYRVGQRLLMLLHAPSAAGMSSPVGGLDGAIPIRLGGTSSPPRTRVQAPFVDLRWLGMRVPRAVDYRSESVRPVVAGDPRAPVAVPERVGAVVGGSIVSAAPIVVASGVNASEDSVPAQQASVSAVMEMLGSWEKARHVAP